MRRPCVGRIVAVALPVIAAVGGVVTFRTEQRGVAADLARPRQLHGAGYAGSAACGACHPEHAASWRRTFHRTMTQDVSPAHPEAVAGDFSGATIRYGGVVALMHRDDAGRFLMSFSPDHAGAPAVTAVVVRAVGSRRYQQYLAEAGGALWRLPVAFHIEENRWFHMNGAFLTPDPEPNGTAAEEPGSIGGAGPRFGGGAFDRHVTRWNDNCVFCHNVAPNPGRDLATGAFQTTVAELGIACESCHGPAAEHVRANQNPIRRYTLHHGGSSDPTIVNPSRLSPARAADLCGRCHGQRVSDDIGPFLAHGDPFVPGDDLALYSAPLWRDTPLSGDRRAFAARFWDDGTPRLTAYEYQGLLESRCAQLGSLTCTTCHGMHDGDPRGQIRPSALGDRACTSCHVALTSAWEIGRHTHHDPTGPGARCVSCHMPRIVYGVLDVHPSHRIEIPDPARAIATGRPDACTLCHVESDRGWAVRERALLWPPRSVAAAAAAAPDPKGARRGGDDAFDDRLAPRDALFAGDPVARALAADAIGRAPWPSGEVERQRAETLRGGELLEAMAGDRYPAVRHLAARALTRLLAGRRPDVARRVLVFDATSDAPDRDRQIMALRNSLSFPISGPVDRVRISALRSLARLADIDIGE